MRRVRLHTPERFRSEAAQIIRDTSGRRDPAHGELILHLRRAVQAALFEGSAVPLFDLHTFLKE